MTTETETELESEPREISGIDLQNIRPVPAVVGGVLGTVGFGGFMQLMGNVGVIAMAIPALYGIQGPSLAVGWGIHLFHGAVLGLVYAVAVSVEPLNDYAERLAPSIGLGVVYGVVTTVLLAGVVMPVWLSTVGFPGAPSLPNITLAGLVGHVVFGVVLAVVYVVGAKLEL